MSETIVLDSNHRKVVRGIVTDSSVLCSTTSAPDVYVHVITAADTTELYMGDGMVIPKMTSTQFYVFRKNTGNDPFSATVVVTDIPASAADTTTKKAKKANMVAMKPAKKKAKSR
jgi:hypothetical protein